MSVTTLPLSGRRCDVFCNVVDNYGDIGVSWRLARQLGVEHGLAVRLWVDDLASFAKLRPEAEAHVEIQTVEGVEVRHWPHHFPEAEPAEIVLETFACGLPDAYLQAMAAKAPRPLWFNVEYLSAEDWVSGCHALPSPHPRLPLACHFFFPGFRSSTGGLLREAWLIPEREAFQAGPEAQAAFWVELGLPAPVTDELRVSLFAYDNPAIPELLKAWAEGPVPVTCLVPEGLPLKRVAAYFGEPELAAGRQLSRGRLQVHVLPFLQQDRYDRLLWACDLNFVRGEDSFVRAQWAARPFLWQIYPQEEEAHRVKLEAFLALYTEGMSPEAAGACTALTRAWNQGAGMAQGWPAFLGQMPVLRPHAQAWSRRLAAHADLASNLVHFCQEKL